MVIAVHVHARFGEVVRDQRIEHALEALALGRLEGLTELTRDVPVGEKRHLAPQQRVVILRQRTRRGGHLNTHQRLQRIAIQMLGVLIRQRLQVGCRAEIGQEQKSALQILRKNLRNVDASTAEELGYMHERGAVLLRRRRIHGNQCAAGVADPKIAAEARVLGRGDDARGLRTESIAHP